MVVRWRRRTRLIIKFLLVCLIAAKISATAANGVVGKTKAICSNSYIVTTGSSLLGCRLKRCAGDKVCISRHLLGRAVDIRLGTASRPILDRVVRGMGGRLVLEIDHYHVEF